MGAVTYYDPAHSGDCPLSGEVWSPGPRKRTLWVRTEDGQYVVVSLDKTARWVALFAGQA